MVREQEIRLECLKLAEAAQLKGDSRPLLVIAEEFYAWITGGDVVRSPKRTQYSTSEPKGVSQPALRLQTGEQIKRQLSIKGMVVEVLGVAYPRGLTALEILSQIQSKWLPSLERTSLSPQLSRLKREGVIRNERTTWFLAKAEDAPSESEASSGPISGGDLA